MTGTWTVAGATGKVITLQSTDANSWNISPAAASITYVSVARSNSSLPICATYSSDGGNNNANWEISATSTCGIAISGRSNMRTGSTVRVAVNGALKAGTGTINVSTGAWSLNATVGNGQSVIVFVEDVEANESTAVTLYDGNGDITGMVLNANVLSIGSSDNQSIAYSNIDDYTNTNNENVMHTLATSTFTIDGAASYTDEKVDILAGNTLTVGGTETVATEHLDVHGTLASGGNSTYNVTGSWDSSPGVFTASTSTVNLTGTGNLKIGAAHLYNLNAAANTKVTTLQSHVYVDRVLTMGTGTLTGAFNMWIFTTASITPISNAGATISISSFIVSPNTDGVTVTVPGGNYGTLTNSLVIYPQVSNSITNISGAITVNGNFWVKSLATKTGNTVNLQNNGLSATGLGFGDGSGTGSDTLTFGAGASTVDLGAGGVSVVNNGGTHSLNMGGATINNQGSWSNVNGTGTIALTPGTSTVNMTSSATGRTITSNGQSFNNLVFNHGSGGWSFSDTASIAGNFTVTTSETAGNGVNFNNQTIGVTGNVAVNGGKLTAGNSTVTVGGDWNSASGNFVFNTSTVKMTGTSKTVITPSTEYWWTTRFYKLTIDTGASVTVQTGSSANGFSVSDSGGLSILGTFTIPAPRYVQTGSGTFNLGASGVLAGQGFLFRNEINTSVNVISGTITIDHFVYGLNNGATTAPIAAVTYGGSLIIEQAGNPTGPVTAILDSGTLSVGGDLHLNPSNVTHSITLDNTINNSAINISYNLLIGSTSTYHGTLKVGSGAISVTGGVTVNASDGVGGLHNTLDLGTTNTFNVGGSWTNNDTVTAGTSKVTLNGTNNTTGQTIIGNTTFYDLTINPTGTGPSKFVFTAGSTTTVSHTFIVTGNGADPNLTTLTSSTTSAWTLNAPLGSDVSYADINYSTASPNAQCAYYSKSTNNGNTGWAIAAGASCNAAPNTPTALTQGTTSGSNNISENAWTNVNQPWFGFNITDPDAGNTVKYRIQVDGTSSAFGNIILDYTLGSLSASGTTFAYQVGQAGTYAVGSASMTLSDSSTGYWWRVYAIDNSAVSSVSPAYFGTQATVDMKVDATAPTSLTVYDGTSVGSDGVYNTGSLNTLSANWTAANFNVSGAASPNAYQYAIGTTAGGTDIKGWTSTNSTAATDGSLTLNTSATYYYSVKATDLAGNETTVNSNGQSVLPTFAVTLNTFNSGNLGEWDDLNSYSGSTYTTVQVDTNAYHGFKAYIKKTNDLRNEADIAKTIADIVAPWTAPAAWPGTCGTSTTCFGYTTTDADISGSTGFGGSLYAAIPNDSGTPGSVASDYYNLVQGTPVSQSNDITYRVQTLPSLAAGRYSTNIMYTVVPEY